MSEKNYINFLPRPKKNIKYLMAFANGLFN